MSTDRTPPQSDPRPLAASLGERLPWDIYEVYRCAWNAYRAYGVTLATMSALSWLASTLIEAAAEYVKGQATDAPWLVSYGPDVFVAVVNACLQAGFLGVALAVAKGRRPTSRDFIERAMRAGPMLFLLNALIGTAFFAGNVNAIFLVYYVVPLDGFAFWFAYAAACVFALATFAFAPYFVVDAGLGPFAALRAAWRASEGKRLHVFLGSMPGAAFGAGPLAAFFPGSGAIAQLVIVPLCAIAFAVAFLRMTGRGALRDALPPPAGLGPAAYRDKSLRL